MTDDDIPLDITGHEDRERPSEAEDDALDLSDGDEKDGESTAADEGQRDDEEDGDAETVDVEKLDRESFREAYVPDEGEDAEAEAKGGTGASPEADADALLGPAEADEEVEPVEVLVNLAEDGEIEPWDIEIVAVTDKFLDRLDEGDLRTSGRALFYASVLLRMKGDAMLDEGPDEADVEDEPWEQPFAEEGPIDEPDPFTALEAEMDRRLERKRARGMPQTLDDLVRELRDAERDSWWKEGREYDTSNSPHGFQRGTQELDYRGADDTRMEHEPTEAEVTGTAHAEDIDEIIDAVYAALREQYDKGREEVLYREIEHAGGSRVETFLGLLFLSHRGRVLLQQDDLFGDLWIQDPGATQGSEEALAD
jgi:segregation and condensation protein A